MTAMTWRRTAIICLATTLLLTACTDQDKKQPEGQQVQIIAGGGTNPNATKALDLDLTGEINDLEVGRDGTVRLLVTEKDRVAIWVIGPDGAARRILVAPTVTSARELAVAPDGTLYISQTRSGIGTVSRIEANGAAVPMVGNGQAGTTADGASALGPTNIITGITVDTHGSLVYGEVRHYEAEKQYIALLRRVVAGHVETLAGKSGLFPSPEKFSQAMVASVAPPEGTKSLDWPLAGDLQLSSLATGENGDIYAQSEGGVLAFSADGTVRSIARRRDPSTAPLGERPFAHDGDAADAFPQFIDDAGITVDRGYVAMPVSSQPAESKTHINAAFRWKGQYTPGQTAIIDSSFTTSDGQATQQAVRLVQPDSSLTTAGRPVDTAAVGAGGLYLLVTSRDGRSLIGRVPLPA
jgi:hypothetical protein